MKPLAEIMAGIVIGLAIGGLMIWAVMEIGDYIVRAYP